jgi:hypothetical protein
MTTTNVDRPASRKPRERDKREPDYIVRAKTGPSARDWTTLGYAWNRDRGEGISVKLNTLPIGMEWGGVLKLLPPFAEEDGEDPTRD